MHKNKKIFFFVFVIFIIVGISAFYIINKKESSKDYADISNEDYKNISYSIEGQTVALNNGYAESESTPGSATKIITKYFGNEIKADFDSDGLQNVAFIITQNSGGSGTFFYLVAAINSKNGYIGTNAILLGDRIAPQNTEFKNGNIIVNYADRMSGEAMTTKPSLGVSKYFRVVDNKLVEVTNLN